MKSAFSVSASIVLYVAMESSYCMIIAGWRLLILKACKALIEVSMLEQ